MKIGFCFIVKHNIEYENIWARFFQKYSPSQYGIYVHPKHLHGFECNIDNVNVTENWVKTDWGARSLTQASINVLQDAVDDGCDYLVLLAGDTVPICSFNDILNMSSHSAFATYPCPAPASKRVMHARWRGTSREFKEKYPIERWVKQNMFFSMLAEDFNTIISAGMWANHFPRTRITDEHFFINSCKFLNISYKELPNLVVCSHKKCPGMDIVNNQIHQFMNYYLDYSEEEKLYTLQVRRKTPKGWNIGPVKTTVPVNTYFLRKVRAISPELNDRLGENYDNL
tara:strand:- start:307 stop:1158 length:852 start_codon:yes stop_codon:yes gene_type:complete